MNDFTKEDLKNINVMIQRVKKDCYTYEYDILNFLSLKIQSMIDNYCDHKTEVWPVYTATGDLPCGGLCFTCGKCVNSEYINENQ